MNSGVFQGTTRVPSRGLRRFRAYGLGAESLLGGSWDLVGKLISTLIRLGGRALDLAALPAAASDDGPDRSSSGVTMFRV